MVNNKKQIDYLVEGIKSNDRRSLARTLSLLDSYSSQDLDVFDKIISQLTAKNNKALRIGFTGIPGVGKSSFISCLVESIIKKKSDTSVGILTIDPSSPAQGGSILGDRIRMDAISAKANVFIRSTASRCEMGGLAPHSYDAIALLEAAGYDVILVETLGVGQSEYVLHSLVDIFAVLLMPASGDSIQGMKKGILELADIMIVNKCDGQLKAAAKTTQNIFSGSGVPVFCVSSVEKTGVSEVLDYLLNVRNSDAWQKKQVNKRSQQKKDIFFSELMGLIKKNIKNHSKTKQEFELINKRIQQDVVTPRQAAKEICSILFS
jgi:LAO/AO transport system kinase